MSSCNFTGNADMYGLGIRLGFYLQWYGSILASWIVPSEVPSLRLSTSLFTAATFLALVLQNTNAGSTSNLTTTTTTTRSTLHPSERYIILLLTFGGYLSFIPLYIFRVLTCFQASLDPSRYPRVPTGPIYSILNFFLLLAVSIFQLWFWIKRAEDSAQMEKSEFRALGWCQEYGFFFAMVRLEQKGFVVWNILLQVLVILCCVLVLVGTGLKIIRRDWVREVYGEDGESTISSETFDGIRIGKVREAALQELNTFFQLIVASTVLAAVELSISWNGIQGVNDVKSAGQTIPIIIGIGLVTRVLYIALFGDIDARYRISQGPTKWWFFPEIRYRSRNGARSSASGFSTRG